MTNLWWESARVSVGILFGGSIPDDDLDWSIELERRMGRHEDFEAQLATARRRRGLA